MDYSLTAQRRQTFVATLLDFFSFVLSVIKFFFRLLNRLVG
jgi:hypothetical protein